MKRIESKIFPKRELWKNQRHQIEKYEKIKRNQVRSFSYYFFRAGPPSPSLRRFQETFGGAQWATFWDFAMSSNFWNSNWLNTLSKSISIGRAIAASLKIFPAASRTCSNAVPRLNLGRDPNWCGVRWSTIVSPLVPNSWSSCRDSGRNPPMLALIWKFNLGILTRDPRNSSLTNRLWDLRKKHGVQFSSGRRSKEDFRCSRTLKSWSGKFKNWRMPVLRSKTSKFRKSSGLVQKVWPPLDSLLNVEKSG